MKKQYTAPTSSIYQIDAEELLDMGNQSQTDVLDGQKKEYIEKDNKSNADQTEWGYTTGGSFIEAD